MLVPCIETCVRLYVDILLICLLFLVAKMSLVASCCVYNNSFPNSVTFDIERGEFPEQDGTGSCEGLMAVPQTPSHFFMSNM